MRIRRLPPALMVESDDLNTRLARPFARGTHYARRMMTRED